MSKRPSVAPDSSERGPKPMSDEEIHESVMGQNTSYLDKIRGASREYGDGGKRSRDRDD